VARCHAPSITASSNAESNPAFRRMVATA
jgi:hypothetical protein